MDFNSLVYFVLVFQERKIIKAFCILYLYMYCDVMEVLEVNESIRKGIGFLRKNLKGLILLIAVVSIIVAVISVVNINSDPQYPYKVKKDGVILFYNVQQKGKNVEVKVLLKNRSFKTFEEEVPTPSSNFISVWMQDKEGEHHLDSETIYPESSGSSIMVIAKKTFEPGQEDEETTLIKPVYRDSNFVNNELNSKEGIAEGEYEIHIHTPFIKEVVEGKFVDGKYVVKKGWFN